MSGRRGAAAVEMALSAGGAPSNSAPGRKGAGGRTGSGSQAGSHARGRDSEEGVATSPARGDDGARLFPAPAPPNNGAQQEGRAPATTPATDDATVVDGIRVPAVWVDSGRAGDYSLGYVAGLTADAQTGFKVAWEQNSTDTTEQQPFQAGWIAGRQQGTLRQTPAPRRASLEGLVTPAVGGAERRGGVLRLTIKHYLEKAKEGKASEWLRDFVHCRTKVVTIGGKVVLRLKQHFFADDETLKSIASHLFLELFGESYDDAMFLEAWEKGMQLPMSTRKRKADDAAETELVTLRNIIKRLYNTARTNFFTSVIKAFRQAAGVPPRPAGQQNQKGKARATIQDPEGDNYKQKMLEAAKAATSKYRMPWLEGLFNVTPALDKSTDPLGTDEGFITLCRVYGFDADAAPEDILVSLLQLAIVSSTINDWMKGLNRSAVGGANTDHQIRATLAFYKNSFTLLGWKTATDEPLPKRITISDYPGAAAAASDDDDFLTAPPVATLDLLNDLDNLPIE